MNTFPYESWQEALADADGSSGYFTFGPGGNTASWVLALLGIALTAGWMMWVVQNERRHLNAASDRLDAKWGIES